MKLAKRHIAIGIVILLILAVSITVPLSIRYVRNRNVELKPYSPILIWNDADFENYDIRGSGVKEDPYVFQNFEIITSLSYGIYIFRTTKYFEIRNCYISASNTGIYIEKVAASTAKIENVTIENHYIGLNILNSPDSIVQNSTLFANYRGIVLEFSDNSSISNNVCIFNDYFGIRVKNSDNCTIKNNEANRNDVGIQIEASTSCIVKDNTCKNNLFDGIFSLGVSETTFTDNRCFNNFDYGIKIVESTYSSYVNNIIDFNSYDGIYLAISSFCEIMYNEIVSNVRYGVYISSDFGYSFNVTIHHNSFINNTGFTVSQASDDGFNNTWFDRISEEGNFWNDYNGSGWYPIDGSANNYDKYPLVENPLDLIMCHVNVVSVSQSCSEVSIIYLGH
jgi:parallel beta-helix repeat protein